MSIPPASAHRILKSQHRQPGDLIPVKVPTPCVRGLRITVYEVLEYLASDMTEEEILDDFPDLTREDLKACIAFAADRERRLMTVPLAA